MTCLKCGRTVPEGILLCGDCRAVKKKAEQPLEISREEQLQLSVSKLAKSRRRLKRLWLVALVLLILSLGGVAGLGHHYAKGQAEITSLTTLVNSLETAMADRQRELEQQAETIETLRKEESSHKEAIEAYTAYTGLQPDEVMSVQRAKARYKEEDGE